MGSYSAAAGSLNVTHAAVAQHVRTLETHFGRPLVTRQGQKMVPTEDGEILAQSLSAGFDEISKGVRQLLDAGKVRPLAVTTTPSFAENWLMPRLGAFWCDHPEIDVSISPSGNIVDLRKDGFDLAIRYGFGDWPGLESEYLASAGHVVVGHPDLLKGRQTDRLTDLADLPWIVIAARPEQIVWAKEHNLDLNAGKLSVFATNGLALSATRAGLGVSIQSYALVENDLSEGRLACAFEENVEGLGYYILTQPDIVSQPLRTFIKWLRCCA
jgi:LysR family glycine cleavage system transcriptional activator